MQKFKKKGPDNIEAQQFHPETNWVEGVKGWDTKYLPRDASWGYIEVLGGKIHIASGDWIFKDENGNLTALSNNIFEKIYEPV